MQQRTSTISESLTIFAGFFVDCEEEKLIVYISSNAACVLSYWDILYKLAEREIFPVHFLPGTAASG